MRTFIGFGQAQYIGQPQTQPIKLGNIQGQAVPLLFQWISYGASTAKPNINILVDVSRQPCVRLDQIRSVYIDNLGSNNPVYVNFPDTNYTVVAQPNSEGWYPAYTNAREFWVIGEGFFTGSIPQTFIIISNLPIQPSVNVEIAQSVELWKASPTISRGTTIYNSLYGTPALGDQMFASALLDLSVSNAVTGMWGTPYASGFIYITNLQIVLLTAHGSNAGETGALALESTGVGGILINPNFQAPEYPPSNAGEPIQNNLALVNLSGMQIKLDATQTWRLRVSTAVTGGLVQAYSSFTVNPT